MLGQNYALARDQDKCVAHAQAKDPVAKAILGEQLQMGQAAESAHLFV